MRGVIAAGTGDDAGPVTDRLQNRLQQRDLLVVGGGGRFPGGAGYHQAVASGVDQMGGYLLGGRQIKRAVRAERRHHGSQHAAQTRADINSTGGHARQITRSAKRLSRCRSPSRGLGFFMTTITRRLLDVIEFHVLPRTAAGVAAGNKSSGRPSCASPSILVIAGTTTRRRIRSGTARCTRSSSSTSSRASRRPRNWVLLHHEPCTMCMSAIAWAVSTTSTTCSATRTPGQLRHPARSAHPVRGVRAGAGGYRHRNAFWSAYAIGDWWRPSPSWNRSAAHRGTAMPNCPLSIRTPRATTTFR